MAIVADLGTLQRLPHIVGHGACGESVSVLESGAGQAGTGDGSTAGEVSTSFLVHDAILVMV